MLRKDAKYAGEDVNDGLKTRERQAEDVDVFCWKSRPMKWTNLFFSLKCIVRV